MNSMVEYSSISLEKQDECNFFILFMYLLNQSKSHYLHKIIQIITV